VGTVLCFLLDVNNSGSILESLLLFLELYFVFFALCYLILLKPRKVAVKKPSRISEQFRDKGTETH